jgi:hypothetical protein
MRESKFQRSVVRKLRDTYPGSVIIRNDPSHIQGIPDVVIFYNDRWAMLEFKRSEDAVKGPNQEYYVERLNSMSFAAFIYPENEEEVLDELQRTLYTSRSTRFP